MKNLFLLGLSLWLFGTLGLACKDKLDKSCDANFLEADVNNIPWKAQEVTALGTGPGGHISIASMADFGTLRQINIQVPIDVSVGTFQLQTGVFVQSIIVGPGGFQAENGELSITVHDTDAKILKGTFFFSLPSEGLSVEAGSFCVKY